MDNANSLDNCKIIAMLLRDIQSLTGVFTSKSLRNTYSKICTRYELEGVGFLTKTLPSLGKALDRALAGEPFDAPCWRKPAGSKLPIFLGELFQTVLSREGTLLSAPNVSSIRSLRQILYLFYKYKIPHSAETAQQCVSQFVATDVQLGTLDLMSLPSHVVRKAQKFLSRVLCDFDPLDIVPRHGPGAVSGKETFSGKFRWTDIPRRTYEVFPLAEFFYANGTHVIHRWDEFISIPEKEPSARVLLVPKDSRGPRLISCEPKEFQWLQQGIMTRLVQHLESHPLTRNVIHFTDQGHNRQRALEGSVDGRYATLDLKEASDRVSLNVVRLLFPEHVFRALDACRSRTTELPSGELVALNKFAPMGSALCFPIMALTIWAILQGGGITDDTCLVYGDDIILPREISMYGIKLLEQFGLKVNMHKSCQNGFFRESCGMDAFLGEPVTPVRLRTVWSHTDAASTYASFLAYANEFASGGYIEVANYIADLIAENFGRVKVDVDNVFAFPRFTFETTRNHPEPKRRWNSYLQKHEYLVLTLESEKVHQVYDGWMMLLRFFTEAKQINQLSWLDKLNFHYRSPSHSHLILETECMFSAGVYTRRKRTKMRLRWR